MRASPSGTTATGRAARDPRARTLHDLEHGGNETAAIGAFIVDRIVRCHLKTMARLNIGYDLLTYEGDILRLQFWAHAFDILKAQGAVFLQTEGKLAGCWVMRIDEGRGGRERRRRADAAERRAEAARKGHRPIERRRHLRRQGHRQPVLEVRPARTRLPLPPASRTQADGRPLWATTSGDDRSGGAALRPRQTHLQRHRLAADVPAGAAQPGAPHARAPARRPRTRSTSRTRWSRCRTRRRASSATNRPRSDGEEAVRRGVGPEGARRQDRRPARSADGQGRRPKSRSATRSSSPTSARASAAQIAVAAIRYFMLKFSRGKLIVFDIEEALSFEGETGPYLQYAVVRANNIFHKLQEREGLTDGRRRSPRSIDRTPADELTAKTTRRPAGRWCSRRRGWTRSSNRWCDRSSSRCWRSTRSASRRCSTRSTTATRSSTRSGRSGSGGAPPAWRTSATQLTRALDLDGHRSPGADVGGPNTMALIGITPCRKLEDYRQSILHVGGEVARARSVRRRCRRRSTASTACCSPAATTSRRRGTARRRIRRSTQAEPGRDEFEIALVALARRADLPDPRDLPRRAGAERRVRRHARAGHPVAGARRARAQPRRSRRTRRIELAHEVWIDKDSLLARLMRERLERRRLVRREQPPSSGGQAAGARLHRVGDGARRRHRSDRGSRGRASASASSGTRRTSGAPASSAPLFEGFVEAATKKA